MSTPATLETHEGMRHIDLIEGQGVVLFNQTPSLRRRRTMGWRPAPWSGYGSLGRKVTGHIMRPDLSGLTLCKLQSIEIGPVIEEHEDIEGLGEVHVCGRCRALEQKHYG